MLFDFCRAAVFLAALEVGFTSSSLMLMLGREHKDSLKAFMHRQKVTPQKWLKIANQRLLDIPEVPRTVCYVKVDVLPNGSCVAMPDGLSELMGERRRTVLLKLLKAVADEVSLDFKIV